MLVYRKMTQEDIPACAKLEVECFSAPWSENSFESALKGGFTSFFVCERAGEIVGYSGVQCIGVDAAITNIAVRESCRGQGIGESLLNRLLTHCSETGAEYVTLEVRLSNAPAIKLYEKSGFKILGTRKAFYTKPLEDAYIMQKNGGQ